MAALTAARSTWSRAISTFTALMPTGYTAWEGATACIDTANPGLVYPAYAGQSTLIPVGWFIGGSVNNQSGTGNVNVTFRFISEVWLRNYDSVTGSGAVTISSQFSEVYLASDHEVTTTAGSNAKAGRVWDVNGDGVWVQQPSSGQSSP